MTKYSPKTGQLSIWNAPSRHRGGLENHPGRSRASFSFAVVRWTPLSLAVDDHRTPNTCQTRRSWPLRWMRW